MAQVKVAIDIFVISGMGLMGGFILMALSLRDFWRQRINKSKATSSVSHIQLGPGEVQGRAATPYDLTSPVQQRPCVFWHYKVEMMNCFREQPRWETIDERRSLEPFYLEDDTGRILVAPRGAQLDIPMRLVVDTGDVGVIPDVVLTFARSRGILDQGTVFRKQTRFTEWAIRAGDPLFVLGTVATAQTQSAVNSSAEKRVIRRGSMFNLMYISEKSRQMVVQEFSARAWKWMILGAICTVGGILGLAFVLPLL